MTRWKWVNGVKNDEWLKKGRMPFAPTYHLPPNRSCSR